MANVKRPIIADLSQNGNFIAKDGTLFDIKADIDSTRWNKSYPYQLLLIQKGEDGGHKQVASFTMPIPPSDLTLSMPFAISTTVTLGGIIEEHNGSPLRTLNFSGTFGVLPAKGTASNTANNLNQWKHAIFAGSVVNAASSVGTAATAVATGQAPFSPPNLHTDADFVKGGSMYNLTGYYQFRLLQQFLESYGNLKRTKKGANYRLAVAIWKDEAVYFVTPVSFDVRRSAHSPWEYMYSLAFRAWGRVTDLVGSTSSGVSAESIYKPNIIADVLNRIQYMRDTVQNANSLVDSVRGTYDNVLDGYRQVGFFVKDAANLVLSVNDLPKNIIQDTMRATVQFSTSVEGFKRLKDLPAIQEVLKDYGLVSGIADTGGNHGVHAAVDGPVKKIFDDPTKYAALFNAIKISDLNLSPQVIGKIAQERQRIRNLTATDFTKMRDFTVKFLADYADYLGLGDQTFDSTMGRSAKQATSAPSQSDYELMFALNDLVAVYNKLIHSTTKSGTQQNVAEYVAGLASKSGIAYKIPQSKFAVPFPYEGSLERLSAQYLGDPNRWHEIATLNGLMAPYIDEQGFVKPLIAAGNKNSIYVADSLNLYIGQPVWLSSTTTAVEKRYITGITSIDSGVVKVDLDGDSDLDKFTYLAKAQIQAYLPNTVNSSMMIYIPSDTPVDENTYGEIDIPNSDDLQNLINVGGIDWLLDQSGDVIVGTDGDAKLAVGLTNIVQTAKIILFTPQGTLLQHPDFGMGLDVVGFNTADVNVKDILRKAQQAFSSDPSFGGVDGLSVTKADQNLIVNMNVNATGASKLIPISVTRKL